MSLPAISTRKMKHDQYILNADGIEDLNYGTQINDEREQKLVQQVIDNNITKLNEMYDRSGLNLLPATSQMNRKSFQRLLKEVADLESEPADEIFSCATNLYDNDISTGMLKDCVMSKSQFAVAIVRLANLWSLINEESRQSLSTQTKTFLDSI